MIENFEELKIVINDRLCYESIRLDYNENKVFFNLYDFYFFKNNKFSFDNEACNYAYDKKYSIFSQLHEKYALNINWHDVIDRYLHETNDDVIAFAIYKNKIEFIFLSGLYMIYKFNKNLTIKPKESNQKFFDKINQKFLIY